MRRSKYHARKVVTPDGVFDSKHEYEVWLNLKALQEIGAIRDLQRQVRFEIFPKQVDENGRCIERKCEYIADFMYTDAETNKLVVMDAKGYRTPEYVVKRKAMLFRHKIRIVEV